LNYLNELSYVFYCYWIMFTTIANLLSRSAFCCIYLLVRIWSKAQCKPITETRYVDHCFTFCFHFQGESQSFLSVRTQTKINKDINLQFKSYNKDNHSGKIRRCETKSHLPCDTFIFAKNKNVTLISNAQTFKSAFGQAIKEYLKQLSSNAI